MNESMDTTASKNPSENGSDRALAAPSRTNERPTLVRQPKKLAERMEIGTLIAKCPRPIFCPTVKIRIFATHTNARRLLLSLDNKSINESTMRWDIAVGVTKVLIGTERFHRRSSPQITPQ